MRHQPEFVRSVLTIKPGLVCLLLLFVLSSLLIGCQPATLTADQPTQEPMALVDAPSLSATPMGAMPTVTVMLTRPLQMALVAPASPTAIPTISSTPTAVATATATATATPTVTPTATPIGPCSLRVPQDDLLILITRQYGLSRDYEPADLVPLADYFPVSVTMGFPNEVRQVIVEPLQQMVHDMQAAGLAPTLISGYRSYYSQGIAWTKWLEREGDRGGMLSAPPGHSEHQLGTTVDFGSPELDNEFHTYFYRTGEGLWLAENAHKYGFTLSYPRTAMELTGFYYEPWHFRYIGVELALHLKEMDMFLTEYQLITQSVPCTP